MEREDPTRLKEPSGSGATPGRLERHPHDGEFGAGDGRNFGLTLGAAFLGLAGVLVWRGHPTLAGAAVIPGVVLALAGLLLPGRLEPVYRAWMAFARAASRVMTPVIMGLIYYLLITPVGLIRRSLGRNPVEPEDDGGSYWVRRTDGGARTDLHRPF